METLSYAQLMERCLAAEAERDAAVVEMAGLKANVEMHAAGFAVCPVCGHEELCETDDIVWMTRDAKTPTTYAAIAALRAEGVEMFAEHLRANDSDKSVCKMFALGAEDFARQLRESKGANHE